MKISNSNFLSIEQLQNQYLKQQKVNNSEFVQGRSFEDILQKQQLTNSQIIGTKFDANISKNQLKFSKHAANRLSDRNIELTDEQLERLNDGTKKAGEKGIKDSLVLLDEFAFIVNTKSNIVITAMEQSETMESVFTNIDGAIII